MVCKCKKDVIKAERDPYLNVLRVALICQKHKIYVVEDYEPAT